MRSVAAMAVVATLLVTVGLVAYRNGPVPGVTGGFGEPTCAQCHQGAPPEDKAALRIQAPATYRPGGTYRLSVRLARAGLEVGGFEMAARYRSGAEAGRQAGELRPADARTQIVSGKGVQYVQHTERGSAAATRGALSWVVTWVAPARPAGDVVFHVAANAANGDLSALGDRIYAVEAVATLAKK